MMKSYLLLLICFSFYNLFYAQVDWDNFTGLESKGPIPVDLTKPSFEKYNREIIKNKELPKKERIDEDFILKTTYSIEWELLNGRALFNDPVTNYLNKVLDTLLFDQKELRDKIRVYTLKSNQVNASCFRQGVLIVTTGLISRLKTEAELAFILSHEISHYTEKHVLEGYEQTKDIINKEGEYKFANQEKRLRHFSQFSKPLEYEADQIGFRLFSKTNYNRKAAISALDMLKSSYLPISNHVFNPNELNDQALKIPSSYFLDSIPAVVFDENYDDSKSSHPNIYKRKEKISILLKERKENYENERDFLIGKEEFESIRKLCRLQGLINEVSEGFPLNLVYMIPYFRKKFPGKNNSLDLYLAKAWYTLTVAANKKVYRFFFRDPEKVIGESLKLHAMIEHLDEEKIIAIGLKNLYKIYKKSNSPEIYKLWRSALKCTISNDAFNFSKCKTTDYYEAKHVHDSLLVIKKDSLKALGIEEYNPNKRVISASTRNGNVNYIQKSKKNKQFNEFDENTFSKYAFSDLLKTESFTKLLDSLKKERNIDEGQYSFHNWSPYNVFKEKEIPTIKIAQNELLILNPNFNYKNPDDETEIIESEKYSKYVLNAIKNFCVNNQTKIQVLNEKELLSNDIQKFNDLNEIKKYFFQLFMMDFDRSYLPSNYTKVKKIVENRKFKYMLVPIVIRGKIEGMEFHFFLVDLETNKLVSAYNRRFHDNYYGKEKYIFKKVDEILSTMIEK